MTSFFPAALPPNRVWQAPCARITKIASPLRRRNFGYPWRSLHDIEEIGQMAEEIVQKWPMNIWIIRHGQSAGNVARDAAEAAGLPLIDIAERDVDVPLSKLGEQQAVAVGQWFATLPQTQRPTVIMTSPYARA